MSMLADKINAGDIAREAKSSFSYIIRYTLMLLGYYEEYEYKVEINSLDYVLILYKRRFMLFCIALSCAILALVVSFAIAPVYTAVASTIPATSEDQRMNTAGGVLAGLGVLAGNPSNERKNTALALLTARATLQKFIIERHLMPILFSDSWDYATKTWKTGVTPPTLEDGYLKLRNLMTIEDDAVSGVIRVKVTWKDATIAANWANGVIHMVNLTLQQRSIDRSNRMIDYLYGEFGKTQNQDLHTNIADLIEQQIKARMLAKSNDDYALEIIDPAQSTKTKAGFGKLVFAAVGLILGFLIGVPVVFFLQAMGAQNMLRAESRLS